jgi:sortase A
MAQVVNTTNQKAHKPVHPKAPVSFRHNLLPPILGVAVFVSVMGLLNSQWIVAQAQYAFLKPANPASIVIDTSAPNKDSVNLSIPKIKVNAPVVYDERSYSEQKVQLALRRGVVHYGTTALPGQAGNIVILGHSSGQAWSPGDYKFVFTMLDKLEVGDTIILDYKGTRYIFKVSGSKVVDPSDLSVIEHTPKPQLTLITCTPVGTDKYRLVVTADQVSPSPDTATTIPPEEIQSMIGWKLPK